jgi:filamentous hemagglutinin family protein
LHAVGPALLLMAPALHAGVTVDKTLGAGGKLSGPNYLINSNLGRQFGSNLFFSFSQFNLVHGESATFFSPASTANIISRVTGGSVSSIDGLIASEIQGTGRTSGANFYFINPAGVIFGPNATVNVGSGFHVSTAHQVRFADGGVFDAANPSASSLTSAAPAAFGFLGGQGSISVQGSSLTLSPGATLSLVGGDIDVNGAVLVADGGRVNLASVQGAGNVALTDSGINASNTAFGNISLRNGASVLTDSPDDASLASGPVYVLGGKVTIDNSLISSTNISDLPGADIVVQANELTITGDSTGSVLGLFAQTGGFGKSGDIILKVPVITLDVDSDVDTSTFGPGQAGSILIQTQKLSVLDGASILSNNASGTGAAGDVIINSSGSITVDGYDFFASAIAADSGDAGAGGDVVLHTPSLTVSNGAIVSADSFGTGNGGMISVKADTVSVLSGGSIETISNGTGAAGDLQVIASRSVTVDGQGGATSMIATDSKGSGDAGNLVVQAPSVSVLDNAQISSDTFVSGAGGDVTVRATDVAVHANGAIETYSFGSGAAGVVQVTAANSVNVDGGVVAADANGDGDAGTVTVTAPTVTVRNTGQISSDNYGEGRGGLVTVQGGTVAVLSGSNVETLSVGIGAAGNLEVTASKSITVDGNAFIAADALAFGDAGTVTVKAPVVTASNGGQISSDNYGLGLGGTVSVQATSVNVRSGGAIETLSQGPGSAGDLKVVASGAVTVSGGGRITADARDVGDAGNVSVQGATVTVSDDGQISSNTSVSSKGGDVSVKGGSISLHGGGIISANTFGDGAGGDVRVTASRSITIDGADKSGTASGILAFSRGTGAGGDIILAAPDIRVSNLGEVNASSYDGGAGGDITVNAKGSLSISGGDRSAQSGIFAATFGQGKGGSIVINAGRASIANSGVMSAGSFGSGAGGSLKVDAGVLDITGGGPGLTGLIAAAHAQGNAGDISVTAVDADITDGGIIAAGSSGSGAGGDIQLKVSDTLRLLNGGRIDSRTTRSDGGNISLQVGNLLYLLQSQIATSVQGGAGNGGNIAIDPRFLILNDSGIVANAFGGNGGNISIAADHFIPSADSLVQASSQLGIAGSISISSPVVNVGQALSLLPANYLDASRFLRRSCTAEAGESGNSLVAVGRGGLPPSGRGPAYAALPAAGEGAGAYESGVLRGAADRSLSGGLQALSAYGSCIAYQ